MMMIEELGLPTTLTPLGQFKRYENNFVKLKHSGITDDEINKT